MVQVRRSQEAAAVVVALVLRSRAAQRSPEAEEQRSRLAEEAAAVVVQVALAMAEVLRRPQIQADRLKALGTPEILILAGAEVPAVAQTARVAAAEEARSPLILPTRLRAQEALGVEVALERARRQSLRAELRTQARALKVDRARRAVQAKAMRQLARRVVSRVAPARRAPTARQAPTTELLKSSAVARKKTTTTCSTSVSRRRSPSLARSLGFALLASAQPSALLLGTHLVRLRIFGTIEFPASGPSLSLYPFLAYPSSRVQLLYLNSSLRTRKITLSLFTDFKPARCVCGTPHALFIAFLLTPHHTLLPRLGDSLDALWISWDV